MLTCTRLSNGEVIFTRVPLPEDDTCRAAYQQKRQAELDQISALDSDYRSRVLLRDASWEPGSWEEDPRCMEELRVQREEDFELGISHRILTHAVEGYLLGCVGSSCVTGESVMAKATSTDGLIAMLQAEEDDMIAIFGPGWEV
jgi:hypothetical protein